MPGSTGAPGGMPVQRSSLRQQIADALRDEVLSGRLAAGRHFTVKEIADLYGVSATPVREALVDLAAQGLLDVEHHRGFQVRQFSYDDYRSMIEARTLVSEGIFRRLQVTGTSALPPDALASVRRRAEAATAALRAGTLDVFIGCDLRFWREFCTLVGNPHASEFVHRLRVQGWMFAVPHLRRLPELSEVCWSGHVALADALRAGDVQAAQRIVEAYHQHSLAMMKMLTSRGS